MSECLAFCEFPVPSNQFGPFSPDGTVQFVPESKQINNSSNGRSIPLDKIYARITASSFSKDGQLLAVGFESCNCGGCANDSKINVYKIQDGSLLCQVDHKTNHAVSELAMLNHDHLVAIVNRSVLVFHLPTRKQIAQVGLTNDWDLRFVHQVIHVLDDNRSWLVAGVERHGLNEFTDNQLKVLRFSLDDPTNFTTVYHVPFAYFDSTCSMSHDGHLIAVSSFSDLYVFDMSKRESDEPMVIFKTKRSSLNSLAFSPNSRYLAVGCAFYDSHDHKPDKSSGYCDVYDLSILERVAAIGGDKVGSFGSLPCTMSVLFNGFDLYIDADHTVTCVTVPN